MENVRAESKGISGRVGFKFKQGIQRFEDDRALSEPGVRPGAAQRVVDETKLPFVVRGYELRRFVEASAEDRYKEMTSWFELDPLLNIQKSLRTLHRTIRTKSEDEVEMNVRLRDLQLITDKQVTLWDESSICEWFNSNVLNQLDASLALTQLSESDPAYIAIAQAKQLEQESIGLAALNRLIAEVDAIADREGSKPLLMAFEAAVVELGEAAKCEAEERHAASQSMFNDIWKSADALFATEDLSIDTCPVCDTKFDKTTHGSCDAVRVSVQTKLSTLADYHAAERKLKNATAMTKECDRKLIAGIEKLRVGLTDGGLDDDKRVSDYLAELKEWSLNDPAPISKDLIAALSEIRSTLDSTKSEIERKQGDNTYANASDKAGRLLQLKKDVETIRRTKAHLDQLHEKLTTQTQIIEDRINNHVQKLLTSLEDEVNRLYLKMQKPVDPTRSKIRFWLSPDPSKNQQQVRLVVDFAPNRKEVAPTGYLSDSQIHSVAIALRLAAIRAFNAYVPIIVLDDIVTSYDADHRKNIASTITEELDGFQIVLVTHDEQFFLLLKDHLSESRFEFRRINQIDPSYGPVFSNYQTPDEVVDEKLAKGDSVGEEIRRIEEEWLLKICREFVVDVAIRPIDKPFQYDRSELASALSGFLKDRKIKPPKVKGIKNPFLSSLHQGVVENFASHFSDNPIVQIQPGTKNLVGMNSGFSAISLSVQIVAANASNDLEG